MNVKMIKYILGWVLYFEAMFMIPAFIAGLIYGEKESVSLLISIVLCLAAGILLTRKKIQNKTMYAREGFFQLLAVSVINLVIVLIGLYYFKSSKVLKVMLTIMSLCTFVMIASSAMRMMIYIMYYYLTFLRIFVLWSLLVLFLIFCGVIAYIVKESFPLFRYSMIVVTCLYIALSFSHPDYWIAKVNLDSTKETRSEFFKGDVYEDYYLLRTLSADAAPVLIDWIAEEGYSFEYYNLEFDRYPIGFEEGDHEYEAYRYLRDLKYSCTDIGIRNFNVSRYIANSMVVENIEEGIKP